MITEEGSSDKTELEEYQEWVEEIRTTNHNLFWALSGLAAEVGEVHGVFEKNMRKGNDNYVDGEINDLILDKVRDELGDVFWYFVATCSECGFTVDEVIENNLNKLSKRKEEGTLYDRAA